ncbi:related to Cut9 interacting protein scn1 [Ustilago trichophora]|uniref:Related to Cut9 interacting protein scn1 n=1 Tax=Ustilago trichophora TaxID=86804 RepID=A0A5C3EQC7_9BASI|nr:related to Cut9 interacting protein scn1 [Ustilago trichophora]
MCGVGHPNTSSQHDSSSSIPAHASSSLVNLLIDTHCHPTDDPSVYTLGNNDNISSLSDRIAVSPVAKFVCMSTNARDQTLVAQLALLQPTRVIPCFGWHPWFTHHISLLHPAPSKNDHYHTLFGTTSSPRYKEELESIWDDLPEPISLETVLAGIEENFNRFPQALLGEVGIDRAFRIPRKPWDYNPHSHTHSDSALPKLTKLKTPPQHQLTILQSQLSLALTHKRNVSLHTVQAAGLTTTLLSHLKHTSISSFGAIRISLHSCTLDNNVIKSILKQHKNIYIGFSSSINHKQILDKSCLAQVDMHQVLVESDHHTVKEMEGCLVRANEYFANLHGLKAEDAAKQLRRNWQTFYGTMLDKGSESSDEVEDQDGV